MEERRGMTSMYSEIALKYNGTHVSGKTLEDCAGFEFSDNASGSADSIALTMNNRTGKWFRNYYPLEGDYIKAWIKVSNWQQGKENGKLYCGKFAIDELSFSGEPDIVQIKAISMPISSGFNITERNRTWKKTSTKQILSDIATSAGVKLVYDADSHSVDEISQSGTTDMEFAFDLCQDYDLAMKLYDAKMVIYDQTRYEKKKSMYTLKKSQLGDYSISAQIRTVYDKVKIQYTKDGKTVSYEFTVPGTKGKRQMFLTESADSIKDAELKAKAALRENRREARTISLTLMGNIKYKAAENFTLEGFGKLDGKYFIDSVNHRKSNGKYTCSMEAHGVVTEF
jgi:hypothetical protein